MDSDPRCSAYCNVCALTLNMARARGQLRTLRAAWEGNTWQSRNSRVNKSEQIKSQRTTRLEGRLHMGRGKYLLYTLARSTSCQVLVTLQTMPHEPVLLVIATDTTQIISVGLFVRVNAKGL